MKPASLLAAALVAASCKAPPVPSDKQVPAPPPPAEKAGAGSASVAEASVDLGDVPRGDWATHVFVIKNAGKGDLHVKNVRGS